MPLFLTDPSVTVIVMLWFCFSDLAKQTCCSAIVPPNAETQINSERNEETDRVSPALISGKQARI